jgi:aryl-alcohol dehydrogenase-like predicted oxidoreductase
MQTVRIDQTDLEVSRLGFGTASLHHLPRARSRLRLLEAALGAGITHFDTSPYYGYGLAEKDLGRFMRARRSTVTIATKVGLFPPGPTPLGAAGVWARKALGKAVRSLAAPRADWTIAAAERSLHQSLSRLGTEYLDILFLHEPQDPGLVPADDFVAWLETRRDAGVIRAWGVSGESRSYSAWLTAGHRILNVVQAHDTLDGREADDILASGRPLQFTYGYLGAALRSGAATVAGDVVQGALERNRTGAVIVSTRRAERIAELAEAAA